MHAIGVGFFVGAGIPKEDRCECGRKFTKRDIDGGRCQNCGRMILPMAASKRVNTFVECGCCGAYHRADFNGDCREDSERHWELPDGAEVVYLDDEDDDEG